MQSTSKLTQTPATYSLSQHQHKDPIQSKYSPLSFTKALSNILSTQIGRIIPNNVHTLLLTPVHCHYPNLNKVKKSTLLSTLVFSSSFLINLPYLLNWRIFTHFQSMSSMTSTLVFGNQLYSHSTLHKSININSWSFKCNMTRTIPSRNLDFMPESTKSPPIIMTEFKVDTWVPSLKFLSLTLSLKTQLITLSQKGKEALSLKYK